MPIYYHDRDCDEEKETEEDIKKNTYDKYYELFTNLGYKKSKKLINYYQMKILSFNTDYNNIQRNMYIKILRDMRKPYLDLFKEDII